MALMVKTYLFLCVAGLCTTLFIILNTYDVRHSNHPVRTPLVRRIHHTPPLISTNNKMTFDYKKARHSFAAINRDLEDKYVNSNQQEHQIKSIHDSSVMPQRILQKNTNADELWSDTQFINLPDNPRRDADNVNVRSKAFKKRTDDVLIYKTKHEPADNVFPDQSKMIHDFEDNFWNVNSVPEVNANQVARVDIERADSKAAVVKQPAAVPEKDGRRDTAHIPAPDAADYTRSCQPQNNIALLKTHKCSSSTLQNILYRWGDQHDLSFVLPKGSMPYLGNPALFDKQYAIDSADGVYNILANHARFSEKGLTATMQPDSIYITILRSPTTQFESLYTYYRHDGRYGASLKQFLTYPKQYFGREPFSTHIVGRNSMLFDLGLDARYLDGTSSQVNRWIQMLDKKFNLVLIAEYFTEALILLKELLCWSMHDIVYLNQNARSTGSKKRLTPLMQHQILQWNSADAKLYDYFNRTLWRKIKAYGVDRMKRDVEILKAKTIAMSRDCVQSTLEFGDPRMWYPPGVKMESFKVNPNAKNKELCDRVTRPELTYMKILVDKQRQRNLEILGSDRVARRKPVHPRRHLK